METRIILIYCLCDDFQKLYFKKTYPNRKMTSAEVMTTALVAALFFKGHIQNASTFLSEGHYIPQMLSKSRLSRRLAVLKHIWKPFLSDVASKFSDDKHQIIDSCPIPICQLVRKHRSQLVHGKQYLGYNSAKAFYFYGLKLHLICNSQGVPKHFWFTSGSTHDLKALKQENPRLNERTIVHLDKAYTNFALEDILKRWKIDWLCPRKSNSKRKENPKLTYSTKKIRKRIETAFSLIQNLFPKKIHAVTLTGFINKLSAFVLGYTISLIKN